MDGRLPGDVQFLAPLQGQVSSLGVAVGPGGLDLITCVARDTFPWVTHVTLAMVGFLLGGKLHVKLMRRQGKAIFTSSVWVTLATWAIVTVA